MNGEAVHDVHYGAVRNTTSFSTGSLSASLGLAIVFFLKRIARVAVLARIEKSNQRKRLP